MKCHVPGKDYLNVLSCCAVGVWRTLRELCCLYFSPQIMQDLCQSERRHFVTLIEVNMHLIVCISGRLLISMQIKTSIFPTILFKTIETHRKSEGENIVKSRT